jgi:SAM-dependent methyltransferase
MRNIGFLRRSVFHPNFLARGLLEYALQRHLQNIIQGDSAELLVLDIGSGSRYYERWFQNSRYIALDISQITRPDIIGVGEALPLKSGTIDLIICIQVLEHVRNPAQVIQEISRVLRPNGTVLLSTHGTMYYHPSPEDYWRWTQAGLRKIFEDNGEFDQIHVEPTQGTFSTLGFLGAVYADFLMKKLARIFGILGIFIRLISISIVVIINLVTLGLDRLLPSLSQVNRGTTLFAILLVRAKKISIERLQ